MRRTLTATLAYMPPDLPGIRPQPPLIYNDIVDKFHDEAAGGWISKEKPPGAAILIFVRENKTTEQKEDNHEQTGERKEI